MHSPRGFLTRPARCIVLTLCKVLWIHHASLCKVKTIAVHLSESPRGNARCPPGRRLCSPASLRGCACLRLQEDPSRGLWEEMLIWTEGWGPQTSRNRLVQKGLADTKMNLGVLDHGWAGGGGCVWTKTFRTRHGFLFFISCFWLEGFGFVCLRVFKQEIYSFQPADPKS